MHEHSLVSWNEKSVIIIPELALNAGWNEVAFKVERFIQCPNYLMIAEPPRLFKEDYSYAREACESKGHSNMLRESTVTSSEGDILITASPGVKDTGLFKSCIVGSFGEGEVEIPSLSDIRRLRSGHMESSIWGQYL